MVTPIFHNGFEKSGKFYVRYDLDHDLDFELDLDLTTKGISISINFPIKNKVKLKKKIYDHQIIFKVSRNIKSEFIMNIKFIH